MRYLKQNVMSSVYWGRDPKSPNYKKVELVDTNLLTRIRCGHIHVFEYTRIDHSAGPGSFADNFEGIACRDCNKILSEKQVY
jgi:hypothetical protein